MNSFAVSRLQAVQYAEHRGAWQQPAGCWPGCSSSVSGPMVGNVQMLCNHLEFIDWAPLCPRQRPDPLLEAVFDVVVDQRLLGLRNGLLDRIQLLGNVEARPLRLDHLDDAAQVTFGAPQALDDFRVGLVDRVPAQGHIPSP